jgi:ribosomal protein S12 methylthiotransferase accessory factor
VRADSNGNAAGSSLEDAILQGILELIERDTVALWWYNRTPMPGVDLSAFGDPWVEEMTARYAGVARELWALDIISDFGVPVVVAEYRHDVRDDVTALVRTFAGHGMETLVLDQS